MHRSAGHNTEEAPASGSDPQSRRILATGAPATLKEQFGDERYRVWTRDPTGAGPAMLAERGLTYRWPIGVPAPDDWSVVEVDVPGGPGRIADLLQVLVGGGVAVARCERIQLSLADLIERVLHGA